jgi:hypothetical protein
MKLDITYDLTEFDDEDANDFDEVKNKMREAVSRLLLILIEEARLQRSHKLREMDEAEQERLEDRRRWDRFMHYCHTGRML